MSELKHEDYAEAIEILAGADFNPHRIAIELAKRHPAIFIECHKGSEPTEEAKVFKAVRDKFIEAFNRGGSYMVESIKLHRSMTGSSLKASKDWVDAHRAVWEYEAKKPVSTISAPSPYHEPEF